MEMFKNMDFGKPMNMLKVAVLGLVGIALIVFLVSLVHSSVRSFSNRRAPETSMSVAPSYDSASYQGEYGEGYQKGLAVDGLTYRNIAPVPPQGTTGNTAEQFEVTDYNALIETRNKAETCGAVANLKSRKEVIFENAQESDHACNFTFKVEHDRATEVLAMIKDLHPKDLSENTRTIKSEIDDFTTQTEILEKKRDSIDETLKNALTAYDQITALAVKTQDASSLAKIIDSKVQLIERMTQERININQQLDYLAKAKAEQMDRLDYTYFTVNVYENKYVDLQKIGDSWKAAIKDFVDDINFAIQDASINLVATLFLMIPYIIYTLLLLVAAKYGWRLIKYIWRR